MITPQEFSVSSDEIRKRLSLDSEVVIVPFGYEGVVAEAVLSILKTRYDSGSLYIRTRPDFFVIENNELYFVEAKQRTKNIEALQLFYNKQYEKMGIKVIYSFPELTINASLIPMEKIVIPQNYQKEFDNNLKHLFLEQGITDFKYVKQIEHGSGDAFVPIQLEDLQLLSEDLLI